MSIGATKIRAFIALKIPPQWERALTALQEELKERLQAFRWVNPEQIHLTLRFLGSISEEQVIDVKDRLAEMKAGPFTLWPSGLGCFPNARRPRVLWAGLKGDLDRIKSLHTAVVASTKSIGEAPEDRPFRPHLTLARIQEVDRSTASTLQEIAASEEAWSDYGWAVSEVQLIQSHLSPQGARYETLHTTPLSPG